MMSTVPGYLAAVVQLTSTESVARNLEKAEHWVNEAAERGARLVTLPENFAYLRVGRESKPPAEPLDGPIVQRMQRIAAARGIYLLLGSVPEAAGEPDKIFNTSVLLDPEGQIVATYRKIHLFDVDIPGQVSLRESEYIVAGEEVVVTDTPLGTFGFSICYDVRFPELYRRLVAGGAEIVFVPSAFTLQTGKDHWHPLLRARAIENQVYVLAAAQYGFHGGRRWSYGKSLAVDPWGAVLAQAADDEGYALVLIDLERLQRVRSQLPCLEHRHEWLWPPGLSTRREGTDEQGKTLLCGI